METDIVALQELIKNDFRGNKSWFAEEIGIDKSYLNEILNKRKSASSNKLCLSIIKWCVKTRRDYRNYIIFLEESVQKNEQQ